MIYVKNLLKFGPIYLSMDIATNNHIMCQFARIFVNVDLYEQCHGCTLVERDGFAFFVDID